MSATSQKPSNVRTIGDPEATRAFTKPGTDTTSPPKPIGTASNAISRACSSRGRPPLNYAALMTGAVFTLQRRSECYGDPDVLGVRSCPVTAWLKR
jgi:hypothetical protein